MGCPTPERAKCFTAPAIRYSTKDCDLLRRRRAKTSRSFTSGARYALEIAQMVGAQRAYLKGGSPSCDREGDAGEILRRGGVKVVRVG